MTNSEAIGLLECLMPDVNDINSAGYMVREMCETAIAALQKQMPIKPSRKEDEFKNCYKYRCPVCGNYFGTKGKHSVIIFDMPKCCDCGQAIDWSGE